MARFVPRWWTRRRSDRANRAAPLPSVEQPSVESDAAAALRSELDRLYAADEIRRNTPAPASPVEPWAAEPAATEPEPAGAPTELAPEPEPVAAAPAPPPEPEQVPEPERVPRPAPGPGVFMLPRAEAGAVTYEWREHADPKMQQIAFDRLQQGGITALRASASVLTEVSQLYADGHLTPVIVAANWEALVMPALQHTIAALARGSSAGGMTRFRNRVELTADSIGAISRTLPPELVAHLVNGGPAQAPPPPELTDRLHDGAATRLSEAGVRLTELREQLGTRSWSETEITRAQIAEQVMLAAELLNVTDVAPPETARSRPQPSSWGVGVDDELRRRIVAQFPGLNPVQRGSRRSRSSGHRTRLTTELYLRMLRPDQSSSVDNTAAIADQLTALSQPYVWAVAAGVAARLNEPTDERLELLRELADTAIAEGVQAAVDAEGHTGPDPMRTAMKTRFGQLRDEHASALGLPLPDAARKVPQAAVRGSTAPNGTRGTRQPRRS